MLTNAFQVYWVKIVFEHYNFEIPTEEQTTSTRNYYAIKGPITLYDDSFKQLNESFCRVLHYLSKTEALQYDCSSLPYIVLPK